MVKGKQNIFVCSFVEQIHVPTCMCKISHFITGVCLPYTKKHKLDKTQYIKIHLGTKLSTLTILLCKFYCYSSESSVKGTIIHLLFSWNIYLLKSTSMGIGRKF